MQTGFCGFDCVADTAYADSRISVSIALTWA